MGVITVNIRVTKIVVNGLAMRSCVELKINLININKMKVEQFFKEWISTRPNLKSEFHDAGIEAMAFADAYHKKQLRIDGVVSTCCELNNCNNNKMQGSSLCLKHWEEATM